MNTNETNRPFYALDDPDHPAPRDGTWVEGKYRWDEMNMSHFKMQLHQDGIWKGENGGIRFPHFWRPLAPPPASATSETPRCDAAKWWTVKDGETGNYTTAIEYDIAKTLERELTAATRRAEEAERQRDEALKMCKELDAQATELLEQMKKNS